MTGAAGMSVSEKVSEVLLELLRVQLTLAVACEDVLDAQVGSQQD